MDPEVILLEVDSHMKHAVEVFKNQIQKISTGAANPNLIASIKVSYYETLTPIREIAGISVPEANQILITPFDRTLCKGIIHAIVADQTLGFTPTLEGDKVRITIPPLTLERRKALVKKLKEGAEHAKVQIRMARQEANKKLDALEHLSEDLLKDFHNENQELTEKHIKEVDEITKHKEKELIDL